MGGFKRPAPSSRSNATSSSSDAKKPRQTQGGGGGGRRGGKRGGNSSTGGRHRKRKNNEEEAEEEVNYNTRRHVYDEEEDEDIQAGYREEGGTTIDDIWIPPRSMPKPPDNTGERFIIDKIVCENFKSYGGIKEMGPFHKSFSAIVGPNGNGKSNIIDAMLFVFGYRASKIRCKKTSVLIHKSELLPDVPSCAVTVHFVKIIDNGQEDSIIRIPNTSITVQRRVDKYNKSVYHLDGRMVQFHEVATFLKANGVDIVHNRFLILQGEVESIAGMPAKQKTKHETGFLEFLEEVIGTRRYMKCLSQLEARVDDLSFEREAKLHAVDIVEKETRELKAPAQKAIEYLRAKNSLTRDQHKFYQWRIFDKRTDLGSMEAEKKEAEEKLGETVKQLDEIKASNADREKIFQEKEKNIKGLEQEGSRLQKNIDNAESQFTKVKEQIQRANTQRKKAMKEIASGEKELEDLEQIPVTAEKEIQLLEKRRSDLDDQIAKEEEVVEKEMKKVESQVEKVLKEKEAQFKSFMEFKKIRDEKKEKSEVVQSELNVLKQQEETERQKLETMKQELEELKEKIKAKERESRSSMGNKVGPMEESIKTKTREIEALIEQERQAKPEMDNKRLAYENAREIFQSSQTNDTIYKAFFAEQAKGRFKGLYGRLRDLATIDEKYNVAATVACGLWDHWVVDTDGTGEEAINFLREKNLPFQNFQCLNKLQRYVQMARRPFKAPQESHRLFDLIKTSKPELSAAFYKALGDTLVAENIDIGSEIAYAPSNRNKVTTLAGEVIDPSGMMTGGGRERIIGKLNGRMAARLEKSISEREYRHLKEDMEKAAQTYNDICTQRQALDSEVRNLSVKLRELQGKLNTCKGGLESMKSQIQLKEKRLAEQEQKVKDVTVNPKVLQQKEKKVKKALEELEAATGPFGAAETATKKVEDKLKILQCEKTKEIRKKLDFSVEQRKKVIEDYNKQKIAVKNYPKNHEKLVKKLESLQTDKTRLENTMRELEGRKKELTETGTKVVEELEKLKEELKTGKAELHDLKKSMAEFVKKRGDLDKERAIRENELANTNAKFEAVAGRVSHTKKKMEELALEEIPEETVEPFQILSEEELSELDSEGLEESIVRMTEKLKNEKPNLGVLEQYKIKAEELYSKVLELDSVTLNRDRFRNAYIQTVAQRLSEFMEGFAIISTRLKEMFRMVSMGGDAELELVDSTDPFSFGINICVRPARKSWKKISYLSGGEKTLASLSLIFALHHFKPSPFYVMDEIDAALDFKNVSIIANYIKDRTKSTQFIIISLRSNMFELADSMLGVFKVDNMSFCMHLGISNLLTQLRSKFIEAGRPFPLENDYQANNREYRRKEMEKVMELKKKKAAQDTLFNNEFSLIDEEDEVSSQSQTVVAAGSQGIHDAATQLIENEAATVVVNGENPALPSPPQESAQDSVDMEGVVQESMAQDEVETMIEAEASQNESKGDPENSDDEIEKIDMLVSESDLEDDERSGSSDESEAVMDSSVYESAHE